MPDFSVTSNIVITAALGTLALFFFGALVGVAAKGKRKCGGFDVFLRILASVCFAASVALLLVAILLRTPDGFNIALGDETAALNAFGTTVDLSALYSPIALVSSYLVTALIAALFVTSLLALIIDCAVANKKTVKPKVTNSAKTPEQRRIAAELAKIRAIGDSAVRRTSAVAEEEKKENAAERAEKTEKKIETKNESETTEKTSTTATTEVTEREQEPAPTEYGNDGVFVGLHDNADSDFDTFDSFDSFVEEEKTAETETDEYEAFDAVDEFTQTEKTDEEFFDDRVTDEAEEFDEVADEGFEETVDEATEETYSEETVEEETTEDTYADESVEEASDGIEDTEDVEEAFEEREEQSFDESNEEEREDLGYDDDAYGQSYDEAEVEPDRNIYFPKARVITRHTQPTQKRAAARTSQKSGVAKSTTSAGARKAAAKPQTDKATSGRSKASAGKGRSKTAPDRKLPVNRRYVILDRRNVVNMFGEYLRERDGEDKDKLRSSINTIIIK